MSQVIYDQIDPSISGTELAEVLTDFKNAIVSGFSGTSRPAELQAGGMWVDMTDPDKWILNMWTGSEDVEVVTIDLINGESSISLAVDSFLVRRVSGDTVGPILDLVKRRIADNGQVKSGDVVGEIRATGRDNTGFNPVVANIVFTATEDMGASSFGGTLSFYSTPQGTNTLVEHMRFINGTVETVLPLKVNSEILTSVVVNTGLINQLTASKVLVDIQGADPTEIRGINSAGESKSVTIHNNSVVGVAIKNQSPDAIAADRIDLPLGDIILSPKESITLVYINNVWRVKSVSSKFNGFTVNKIGVPTQWVAPASISQVRLTANPTPNNRVLNIGPTTAIIDDYGKITTCGVNNLGQLGDGTTVQKSSPVMIVGGHKFQSIDTTKYVLDKGTTFIGLNTEGRPYAWGSNLTGLLGDNTTIPKSTPVLVLGNHVFEKVRVGGLSAFAIKDNGNLFAWGANTDGQLGDNTIVQKNTPVAIAAAIKFREIYPGSSSVMAVSNTNEIYMWGANTDGQLGDGTVVAKRTPTRILNGVNIVSVAFTGFSAFAVTDSGDLYSWGSNQSGVLGLGDTVSRSTPTLVAMPVGVKVRRVITGFGLNIAHIVAEDGTVYGVGANLFGSLGDGSFIDKSTPSLVVGGNKFKKLVTGTVTMGITENGDLYSWGTNTYGELGLGDLVNRNTPTKIAGIKAATISLDDSAAIAIAESGQVYAWGLNNGQLRLGDTAHRSTPTLVLGNPAITPRRQQIILDIPVVGGQTYDIVVGEGMMAKFGTQAIGLDIETIDIEHI